MNAPLRISPLHDVQVSRAARWVQAEGMQTPASFGADDAAKLALAGIGDLGFRRRAGVKGAGAAAWRLADAARTADLILVEGVMGLFDGSPSAAELAERIGIPILAVIDGASMANSFGAIAYGLKRYRPGTPLTAAAG